MTSPASASSIGVATGTGAIAAGGGNFFSPGRHSCSGTRCRIMQNDTGSAKGYVTSTSMQQILKLEQGTQEMAESNKES